jgi:hypothetical protein
MYKILGWTHIGGERSKISCFKYLYISLNVNSAAETAVYSVKFGVFWDILQCRQTDVDICLTTRQNIPEESELHTRRRENLKPHIVYSVFLDIATAKCMCRLDLTGGPSDFTV